MRYTGKQLAARIFCASQDLWFVAGVLSARGREAEAEALRVIARQIPVEAAAIMQDEPEQK